MLQLFCISGLSNQLQFVLLLLMRVKRLKKRKKFVCICGRDYHHLATQEGI